MYCPRCQLQYRAGRTQCSECDFELASNTEAAPEPPGPEMVVVFEGHLDEAETAQAAMESTGIESRITSWPRRGVSVHHGLSQLQVRAEDEDAAKEALFYPNG
ncbi:MAG TPA: hypothetical protein VMZ06_15915 [Candidatus Bathyarchaeia archaeon]|nr:hypothetical protein [Candidatus Bathyarchaeia archaeon]